MGYDLYPMDTLFAKQAFGREAATRETLVFFEHDPAIPAAFITEQQGKRSLRSTHMSNPTIGIIGGSGLYDMGELTDREERVISTPFGEPSGPYVLATLRGKRVAFLARHGAGHRLLPSELNFRANIYGFKVLGIERILSASAVGSLKEEYRPLDIVVPDQFFDRTKGRISTFFGRGHRRAYCVCASAVWPPVGSCRRLRRVGRRHRASRRHLRHDGGAAILDAVRVDACIAPGAWT